MNNNVFYNDKCYVQSLSPMQDNITQVCTLMSKKYDIPYDDALSKYNTILKDSNAKAPIVKHYERGSNGDKVIKKTPLNKYINNTKSKDSIIVPSFTTYTNSKIEESKHKKLILEGLKNRTKHKKLAAAYYADKNMTLAAYHTVLQKSLKIINNSFSGAYGSGGTVLYNISAHYSLTSITRAVASIGNSITESMVSGNRHYWNTTDPLDHISSLISTVDRELIKQSVEKYKLKIPTVEQVYEVILYSSRMYWKSDDVEKVILDTINKLDDIDRCIICYTNDLFTLRLFNEDTIRDLINNLSLKVYTTKDTSTDRLHSASEEMLNLLHHICIPELRGLKVNYDKLPKDTKETLLGTYDNIMHTFSKYSLLIESFFLTKSMPINIVDMPDMTRRSIALSDTDSTCGSYHTWVTWFFGDDIKFGDDEVIGLTASVMTIVSGVVRHYLRVLASNMNVAKEDQHLIDMKNEYYWDMFVVANKSKHYFARKRVVEMAVLTKPGLEVKGSGLVASGLPEKYRNMFTEFTMDVMDKMGKGIKLDGKETIKYVADIERDILSKFRTGDYEVITADSINEPKSYKQGPKESKYKYVTLWNETLGLKYGLITEMPCRVYNVKTTMTSSNKLKTWISNIKDETIRDGFNKHFSLNNMSSGGAPIIRVPVSIVEEYGIPVELDEILDVSKLTSTITAPFITVLETLGLFTKPDTTLISQGY